MAVLDDKGRTRHEFIAQGPDQLWLGDITERWNPSRRGKMYVCSVREVYSNRIVGYSVDSRMKSRIAAADIDNARCPAPG